MPQVDGYEVARRIKNNKSLEGVPLVAVTAYAMVGDRDQILSRGFDGYIPEPIDPINFIRRIEEFLMICVQTKRLIASPNRSAWIGSVPR